MKKGIIVILWLLKTNAIAYTQYYNRIIPFPQANPTVVELAVIEAHPVLICFAGQRR